MSTKAQIDANRVNAQNSTGPVSADGKARVALNAVTHGLSRVNMFLSGEEPEEFVVLRDALLKRYRCSGADDAVWADEAAMAWWKIRRIAEWQAMLIDSAFADQPVPAPLARLFGDKHEKCMQTLHRHETSARSAMHRAINQLRALRSQEGATERREQAETKPNLEKLQAMMQHMMNSKTPNEELLDLEADLDNRANPISSGSAGRSDAGIDPNADRIRA
jgi:hypothetical protein